MFPSKFKIILEWLSVTKFITLAHHKHKGVDILKITFDNLPIKNTINDLCKTLKVQTKTLGGRPYTLYCIIKPSKEFYQLKDLDPNK